MANLTRIGFGQVEPNHLSARHTGEIYAQGVAPSTMTQLENGQFVNYNGLGNELSAVSADQEPMMVYNEVKLYDNWRESYKDFVMVPGGWGAGITLDRPYTPDADKMVPRVIKINVGDMWTTNTLKQAGAYRATTEMIADTVAVGTVLGINANGFLDVEANAVPTARFKVVKVYELADKQAALKVMRIKDKEEE